METIDFTKPDAFTKSTAAAAQVLPGHDPLDASTASGAAASNPESAQRLRRRLGSAVFWTLLMLLVWGAGAALLTLALQQAQPGASALQWPPDGPQLLANMQAPQIREQMFDMAWMALDLIHIPVLVFAVFVWVPIPLTNLKQHDKATGKPGLGLFEVPLLVATFVKFAALVLCLLGAGYVAMAAVAFAEGDDPLEILPGVTPPYLRDFLAQHPTLTADGANESFGHVRLQDGLGHSVRLHRTELDSAQASFEPCPPTLGAAQLGGIPPFPGIPCTTLLRLRNAQGGKLFHVFEILDSSNSAAIKAHFGRWADAHGSGSASSNRKGGGYTFSTSSRDDAWHLDVNSWNGGTTSIVIRHKLSP